MGHIRQFLGDEGGATAIEYGLIASLVVLSALIGMQAFGDSLMAMYSGSDDSLSGVIGNAAPGDAAGGSGGGGP